MASPSYGTFGALLRRLRTTAGLTREALAAASGVGVRTVSDLERGWPTNRGRPALRGWLLRSRPLQKPNQTLNGSRWPSTPRG